MTAIVRQLEETLAPGTVIPKPHARSDFVVKGWGKRRGEPALVYNIPNHKNPQKPHQKGVTVSEWTHAFVQLTSVGEITGSWFRAAMPACAKEGYCNFTTIGGVFELLGFAVYDRERYLFTGKSSEPAPIPPPAARAPTP
jgi:hypothetical protein